MNSKILRSLTVTGIALITIPFISVTASATIVTAILDTDFSGTKGATVDPIVTFDDMGTPGTVRLKVDITGAPTANKISDLWFNFSGDATTLAFSSEVGAGTTPTFPTGGIETCMNCTSPASFRPDGDGYFDIHFDWPTDDASAFKGGTFYQVDISLTGITASDFNILSIAGPGDTSNDFHCAAVHIQGLTGGDGSDHLGASTCSVGTNGNGTPMPEPGTLAILGLGLVGLGLARRKRAAA